MSGTSLDGIDALLVDFSGIRPRALARHHLDYPEHVRHTLHTLCHAESVILQEYAEMEVELGRLYARVIDELLQNTGTTAKSILAIGNHGQTIRHHPHGTHPHTIQLGDAHLIAELTGITTIADFRRRDIAAGGQGAPLVPAFHATLFRQPGQCRVVLNLGGMANISILPADPDEPVHGFDTGPANVLLDEWAGRHLGTAFDAGGEWAAGGNILHDLLDTLLQDTYFHQPPPKSTGREHFNLPWLESRLSGKEPARDVQATLMELTAKSIASAIHTHAAACSEVLACGGGAKNPVLLEHLRRNLVSLPVRSTVELGHDPQDIEAMAFAWLARQALRGQAGNLPAVTGARHPVILGAIFPGSLYGSSGTLLNR